MSMNTIPTAEQPDPMEPLRQLGWDASYGEHPAECAIEPGTTRPPVPGGIARILSAQRNLFLASDGREESLCAPAGRLLHGAADQYPVTGDWVVVDQGMITRVLPRKSILCRGEAGTRHKNGKGAVRRQPIGANIDTVFIVCGLDRDYNLRRLERYLALVYNCGISPVIVLTKADLHDDPEPFRDEVEGIAFGVSVVLTAMHDTTGPDELHAYLAPGRTVAMIGSSGAGKSTLANRLYGSDLQATAAVSDSVGKGRHTTTVREIIRMPQGGLLMDNPGIREIALCADGEGLDAAFPDIRELSGQCRFADCTHRHEPGCAVLRAAESGELPEQRLASYHKMQREMEYAAARCEKSADRVEKERWKDVALAIRRLKKHR